MSNPAAGTADVRAISDRVRPGDHVHAMLVRLPLPFNGSRITVTGARYDVASVAGGRDVWVYPTGGAYRVLVSR